MASASINPLAKPWVYGSSISRDATERTMRICSIRSFMIKCFLFMLSGPEAAPDCSRTLVAVEAGGQSSFDQGEFRGVL
jgi:hypothetical protein